MKHCKQVFDFEVNGKEYTRIMGTKSFHSCVKVSKLLIR